MVAYLPAPVRSIEAQPNNKGSEKSDGGLEWAYLMIYQANTLKNVRDAFLQNLSIVSSFISRCGDRSTLMEDRMSLSDSLSSQTHWRRFGMHLCRTFPFTSRCGDQSTLIEDWMILSDGLSSQTHWRIFVTHLKSPRGGWIGDNANQCTNLKCYDATITRNKIRSRIPREKLWTPSSWFL